MAPNSKFKSNDGILSMYLVPKKMFNDLLSILDEDEENRNELIAMNKSQTNNNNYIENAIAFKNQQNEQKKNNPSSNLQKFDITDNQSAVSPNTLSKTVSTFRPSRPSLQRSDTFPTNVTSEITLPESRTPQEQEKSLTKTPISKKKSLTFRTSTPDRRMRKHYSYTNSPILRAVNTKNKRGKRNCPVCNKEYVDVPNLAKHLLQVHSNKLLETRVLRKKSESDKTPTSSPLNPGDTTFSTPSGEASGSNNETYFRKTLFQSKYPKL